MIKSMVSQITEWDTRIFHHIFRWNGKGFLDRFMVYASRSGDGYLYGAIGIYFLLFNHVFALEFILAGALAFAIELPIYGLAKRFIHRPRPFDKFDGIQNLMVPPDKFSFPSGHTAAAFLMATVLSVFFPVLTMGVFTWAWLIGFSRMYLGLHYPTDVLAGSVLGALAGRFGIILAANILQLF